MDEEKCAIIDWFTSEKWSFKGACEPRSECGDGNLYSNNYDQGWRLTRSVTHWQAPAARLGEIHVLFADINWPYTFVKRFRITTYFNKVFCLETRKQFSMWLCRKYWGMRWRHDITLFVECREAGCCLESAAVSLIRELQLCTKWRILQQNSKTMDC